MCVCACARAKGVQIIKYTRFSSLLAACQSGGEGKNITRKQKRQIQKTHPEQKHKKRNQINTKATEKQMLKMSVCCVRVHNTFHEWTNGH